MSLPTEPGSQDQNRETRRLDSTNDEQEVDSGSTSGSDSDFVAEKEERAAAKKAAAERAAAERAAAERAAAERAAAERAAAERAAAERAAAEKAAAERAAAERAAAEKAAAERAAAEKAVEEKSLMEDPDKLIPTGEEIGKRLKDLIKNDRKLLQKMYGKTEAELDEKLKEQIGNGEKMARRLITEMGCKPEVAKELTVLTLYDVAILIDDSDSMSKRKNTLIQFIDHITTIYSMANKTGILAMRFINGSRGKKNWTGKSRKYLDRHSYSGLTRIGTELKKKILDNYANANQSKPLLVLTVTDGTIEGEKKGYLKRVIRDCVNECEEAGKGLDAVSFQFSHIGNDPDAKEMLIGLDDDQELGEFIDVLPLEFDFESQLEDKWFVLPKILLGAILPDWDGQDYRDQSEAPDHIGEKKKGKEAKEEEKGSMSSDSGDSWEADDDSDDED